MISAGFLSDYTLGYIPVLDVVGMGGASNIAN